MKNLFLAVTYSILLLSAAVAFADNSDLNTVGTFEAQQPPGNITITPSGRKFYQYMNFMGKSKKSWRF
jgi:hypothetical protein